MDEPHVPQGIEMEEFHLQVPVAVKAHTEDDIIEPEGVSMGMVCGPRDIRLL